MRFKDIIRQPIPVLFVIFLGWVLPRKIGWKIAGLIGIILGSFKNTQMVKAIRANQWVIHEKQLSQEHLDKVPRIVFKTSAKCIFDFFHYLSRPNKLKEVVFFSPEAQETIDRIRNNQPCVVVCPHLSNFELMGYALAINDVRVQILSVPNPVFTYKMQNQLRETLGMYVTPINLSSFRQARNRLREGGSVLTGLDRPLNDKQLEKYQPEFFGHRANLPVAYVRMAKEAGVPVFIMATTTRPDGRYCLEGTGPIFMDTYDNLETEIMSNVNKVLSKAEVLIKENPYQWSMFYPVWPQFLGV